SEELQVEDVSEGVLPSVGGLWKTHLVEAQVDGRTVTLPVLHEEEEARFVETLKRLRHEALGSTRKWEDYYTLRECFPRLDYGYALTIHKSQGSTFETVYIDHRDALRCAVAERRRLLYVAITRPSVRLALLV
ncbi:MAG: ATP-binding domain-containing protein, partial [Gemmatimonadetes bacterium]|nr:ATP-binding domain-containing protein [Gemmatimonadota bacterium]